MAAPDFSKTIRAAAQAASVQAALRAKGERTLPRAQRLAYQAGANEFGDALHVETGTRPGTKAGGFRRPYARVIADMTEDMKGKDSGAKLTRRDIMRRASRA